MRSFILISLIMISTNSFANSRGQLLQNISRLTSRIQLVAPQSDISNQELQIIQNNLKAILNKLNNRSDTSCIEFTLEIYERVYSGQTALTKAKEACTKISDVSLVRYIYEIYLESYSEKFALEKAVDRLENKDFFGKTDELEFIYPIYKLNYSPSFAIEKSLDKLELLSANSLDCLEFSYRTLSRSYSPVFALNKAIDSCK